MTHWISGVFSGEVTPESIPNSVVKIPSADGTAYQRESRSMPDLFLSRIPKECGFFLLVMKTREYREGKKKKGLIREAHIPKKSLDTPKLME